MACGTPVIAFNRGSMPELIIDGVTGFLVDTLEEAIAAVGRIGEIDRAACRAHVIRNFTDDVMADRYLTLYRSLLNSCIRRGCSQESLDLPRQLHVALRPDERLVGHEWVSTC